MAIKHIKCPRCGGIIEADTEKQFATCQNCGKTLKKKEKTVESNKASEPVEKKKEKKKSDKTVPVTVAIIFAGTIGILIFIYLIITADTKIAKVDQTTTDARQNVVNEIIDAQEKQKDNFKVEYKSSTIIKSNGKPYLLVKMIFTNKSDKAEAFSAVTNCETYQNGVQLTNMIIFLDEQFDASLSTKKIQPGMSLEVQEVFELIDTTSPVSLNVNPLISTSDFHYLSIEIKMK